ncbi:MAG: hypothetical protein HC820_06635 [Hydrococcus sp. RM1_1_31]|nr:hypothetical protein [Hydrococcus sp. RM1_1_31]
MANLRRHIERRPDQPKTLRNAVARLSAGIDSGTGRDEVTIFYHSSYLVVEYWHDTKLRLQDLPR